MMAEFNDNVSFKKNEYETVEISVLDIDPKRAAAMCDSIILYLDQKILSMHRIKYLEAAKVAKNDMDFIMHQIDSVETRMDFMRKEYKILDYKLQAKEITKGMVEILVKQKENTSEGRKIEEWMKNLKENGGEYDLLSKQQTYMVTQYDALKKIYDEAVSGANKKITYGERVQNPVPADKKSYPVRWLIVLISTIAALFISMIVVLFLENKKSK
jgi:capsule polysaccharide export protein KpsE/RkpR